MHSYCASAFLVTVGSVTGTLMAYSRRAFRYCLIAAITRVQDIECMARRLEDLKEGNF